MHRFRAATVVQLLAVLAGIMLVSLLVVRTTRAAFTATTSNAANSWTTGSVAISDDDAGVAMFSTGTDGTLTGGQVLTKCIVASYTGTIVTGTNVELYGSASGALAPYLTLTIDQGTGGSFGNCTGFTGSQIYSNTLDHFNTNHSTYGTGLGTWSPSANPETQTYRFTITVSSVVAAQGKSATGSFTWEAQA